MAQAWIIYELTAHGTRPVTHAENIFLKSYFDEDPRDTSDHQESNGSFIVPVERSVQFQSASFVRVHHQISAAEFNAGTYDLFVWCDPYGTAALAKPGGLAVGRIQLGRSDEARRTTGAGYGVAIGGIAPDDDVIVYRLELANSVVQFIVDEMNANRTSPMVLRHRDMLTDHAFLQYLQRPFATLDTYRQFHTDSGWQGYIQNVIALGGGDWDHKPRIGAVWGTDNRLGNSVDIYYYDYWSNIHYGYIMAMAGYQEFGTFLGANIAQVFDRGGTENRFDTEPTLAGWNLGHAHGLQLVGVKVTRDDIINILSRHPHWPQYSRSKETAAPSRPSTIQQLQQEMQRFERMSPLDQVRFLQSMFGGRP